MFRFIRKWLHLDIVEAQLKATYKFTRVVHSVVNHNAALVIAMRREMKERFMNQEDQLKQILVLLQSVASGVSQIITISNGLPGDNPAIQDEIDSIKQIGQQISDSINATLNPTPATGEPVTSATREKIPVNANNETLIMGGTTSDTPKVKIDPDAHPAGGMSNTSGDIKPLSGPVSPTFEEYLAAGYDGANYPPRGYRPIDTEGWRREQKRRIEQLEQEERDRADAEAAAREIPAAPLTPLPVARDERTRVSQRRVVESGIDHPNRRQAPADRRQGIQVVNDFPVL